MDIREVQKSTMTGVEHRVFVVGGTENEIRRKRNVERSVHSYSKLHKESALQMKPGVLTDLEKTEMASAPV